MLDGIRSFITDTFQTTLMSDAEIEQLSWCVGSNTPTPEKDMVKTQGAFIQVRRCTSRLYCLSLLRQGKERYQDFIAPQQDLKDKIPLSREQYLELCLNYAPLNDLSYEVLRLTIVISSVTLSSNARKNADEVLGKGKYTEDSIEFLADTFDNIEHAKKIYPLVKALFDKYPASKDQEKITKLLQATFAHKQHYRHMLYTEGNENMFQNLLDKVRAQRLDEEGFHFWRLHWQIDIAGFRGHLSPKGSIYLTSETFRGMMALEESLKGVFTSNCVTTREILNSYLDKRAAFLQLMKHNVPVEQQRLFAHVASMLRLYTKKEGAVLAASISLIPSGILKRLSNVYLECPDKSEPTPTYAPAFFENIIDHCKQRFQKEGEVQNKFVRNLAIYNAIAVGLPLYLQSLELYRAKRKAKQIPEHSVLSFRESAYKKEVTESCRELPLNTEFNVLKLMHPKIDEKGIVGFFKVEDKTLEAASTFTPAYQAQTQAKEQDPKLDPTQEKLKIAAQKPSV